MRGKARVFRTIEIFLDNLTMSTYIIIKMGITIKLAY